MKTGTVSVFLKNKTFIDWPLRFWWFPPQTQVLQCVVKVFVNLFCFFSRLKVWEIFSDLLYKLIQNLNCHLQNIKQKSQHPLCTSTQTLVWTDLSLSYLYQENLSKCWGASMQTNYWALSSLILHRPLLISEFCANSSIPAKVKNLSLAWQLCNYSNSISLQSIQYRFKKLQTNGTHNQTVYALWDNCFL